MAAAGHVLRVPLTVEGAAAGHRLDRLTVEVSYDGGRSWRGTAVHGTDHRFVRLAHPRAARTVPLRTMVRDRQGNVGRQTV